MADPIKHSTQILSRSGVITSAGTLLASNDVRESVIIQNLGTAPLFVKFGAGAATNSFDFVLKGGTGNDDGNGGVFLEDVLSYTGIITVASSGSVRCTATEF